MKQFTELVSSMPTRKITVLRFWLSHSKHLPSLAPLHSLEAIRSSCPWSPDLCSRSVQTQFSAGLNPGLMRNPMVRVGGHLFVEVGDTATGHGGGGGLLNAGQDSWVG